ncbi:P-loop containing nucleoside triphosphate hydrolase protein [Armillaria mellea]|nr:P-loop containing nucleoside triphosphate hydrolase protein [Armillaria mellea]
MKDKSDRNVRSDSHDPTHRFVSYKLGVWRLVVLAADSFDVLSNIRDLVNAIPLFFRMTSEIYALDPLLTTLYVVAQFSGLSSLLQTESTLMLYLSSKLLKSIETGITQGFTNYESTLAIIVAQLIWIIAAGSLTWYSNHFYPNFRRRVAAHYKVIRMKVELEKYRFLDSMITGSEGNDEIHGAWDSFSAIVSFLSQIASMCIQIVLIAQTAREFGHPSFAAICIMKPLYDSLSQHHLWGYEYFYHAENGDFKRMHALWSLTAPKYRSEVLAGGLSNYIVGEYAKSSSRVGNIPTSPPEEQYGQRSTPFADIFSDLLGNAPMMYLVISVMTKPSTFSVTSFTVLQRYSANLQFSLKWFLASIDNFRQECQWINRFYDSMNIPTGITPPSKLGSEKLGHPECMQRGMSFDLRDVCFSYENNTPALEDICLSIKSEQLIAIILVDGHSISDYSLADFRRATACFMQDHEIFPLSFWENIRMGDVDYIYSDDEIMDAIRKGGAEGPTILRNDDEPSSDHRKSNFRPLDDNEPHPLLSQWKQLETDAKVSGGEKQRIVAARTFMRFHSGKVNFVAVDEASSALDAAGEAQLFENLISERAGKTIAIVTHRFGPLTRRADLILCMKDGRLYESGRHDDLLALNGEYARLYNIQAGEFANGIGTDVED